MAPKNEKRPWDLSRIILVCGVGGVGKTTLSAAMAVKYALQGYKTVVLTVDPANRLAQALGLNELSSTPQRIDLNWEEVGKNKGSLDAMMLNTKRTFDRIIYRYSPDEVARNRILDHPLYKHLSTMIAGSQEYMAMENLYQIATEYDYEKIIMDTPPSKHALDLLDAPGKMVGAITNSLLKLLIKPSAWAGKKGSKLLGLFGRMAGVQFFQELSDFLSSTISLLDGFKERAEDVTKLVGSEDAKLILVTAPTSSAISDASNFVGSIETRGLRLVGTIINKVLPRISENAKDVRECAAWCGRQSDPNLREIGELISFFRREYKLEDKLIKDLGERNPDIPIYTLSYMLTPIHNINGLIDLYAGLKSEKFN